MPTVIDQDPFNEYTGNGVTTLFAYEFQVLAAADLVVKVNGAVVASSEYTLTGVGSQTGGTVEFDAAPASGVAVLLAREMALERATDYQEQGDLLADTVNQDFNRLWLALQQQRSSIGGAVRAPFPELVGELPAAADRALRVLAFDSSGQPIAIVGVDSGSAAALAIDLANASIISKGDALIGVKLDSPGAVARNQHSKNAEIVSVKDFGAVGDGVTDDTAAIQRAINEHRGKIYFPAGTYKISATLILKNETILIGEGAGAYFQGAGYPRLTVLQPTASFSDADVLRADPADDGPGAAYRYGIALRDMLIDCINIKNQSKTVIRLNSLSNSETFDSIRIINNNAAIAIRIGVSVNVSALESDGLSFSNIYCLQCDSGGSSTNPVLMIESANEVSFRDSKFQRGTDPTTAGSKAAHVNGTAGRSVNAITFDGCSFTGAESGLLVQSENTDGQGPRWIRVQNSTFEGPKFPIYAVGDATRPVQFCTFGPGNRMISLAPGGTGVVLGANASNNTVIADEFTTVLFDTLSSGNTLIGGNTLTDSGTNNARVSRNGNAVQVNNSYIEAWITATPGSSWTNGSPANRTSLSYRKDSFGRVHLQGYLSGGLWGSPNYVFTLPAGYRPPANKIQELVAAGNGVVVRVTVLDTGEVFGIGSGTLLILDGISFPTN